ncbi:MAG: hypothetical protein EAZ95_08605 [Bacteroidetes bacterium]|nr:MAG: hypothetical protein EAZ95_08605 [Bacteroidota bacterium]
MVRICFFSFLLLSSVAFAQKTPQEYEKAFPADFHEALAFMKEHKALFVQELGKEAGDVRLLASVAFPEMVRYSELSNMFETMTIEALYVKYGTKYADFSIGYFQMKPSFVEKMEAYLRDNWLTTYQDVWQYEETIESEIRQKRIARLRKVKWQLRYLRAFYGLMLHKFPTQMQGQQDAKVKFLASAYNRGFEQSETEILRWSKVFAFPHGSRYTGKQYNYAEVASYFYTKYSSQIF